MKEDKTGISIIKKWKVIGVAFLFFSLGAVTTLISLNSRFSLFGRTSSGTESSSYLQESTPSIPATPTPVNDPYPEPDATIVPVQTDDIKVYTRTDKGYFYTIGSEGVWGAAFLKGVNMGLTLPTTNLDNPDIPYETYYRWLEAIHAMNANTVKIFTIMNPDFYSAFYDYNQKNPKSPLYLLQGIWVNENDMNTIKDVYGKNSQILNQFKKTAKEIVDIVHGNSSNTTYGKLTPAIYDKDISPYIAGFILGLEWMPEFIQQTNDNNPGRNTYNGKYLYTKDASPFESFLCNVGDTLAAYQTSQYRTQTPIAFLNWSTTDILTHTNEPFPEEDGVSLDTRHILATPQFFPGLFAAIDIYPYYPEFLNYQQEYISYTDPSGKKNPYRAYLRDLKKEYTVPVVVAEFGVPTSRGIAHKSFTGYNQGGITEEQQGDMNLAMMKDIAKEGYAGAMIFSWQDEWFKQTWNTIKYYATDTQKRTPNAQSAEQHYGILAFDPVSEAAGKAFYPDGALEEWVDIQARTSPSDAMSDTGKELITWKISTGTDALSILCQWNPARFNPETDTLFIALGTTRRGSVKNLTENLVFTSPTDFILKFNGKNNTRLLVDSYYDSFQYQYSVTKKIFPIASGPVKKNSGVFNPVRQFLSNEIVLPVDKKTIDPVFYESGLMRFGQTNPQMPQYDSLADYYYTKDSLEVKIPWALLGVMNFAERRRLADFTSLKSIKTEELDSLFAGVGLWDANDSTRIQMEQVDLTSYEKTAYQERLKKSYAILSQGMSAIMKNVK